MSKPFDFAEELNKIKNQATGDQILIAIASIRQSINTINRFKGNDATPR